MSDEIAKLVIAVDSTSAKAASADLDRLATSAGRASSSMNFSKVVQASDAALARWAGGLEKVRALSGSAAGGAAESFTQASHSIKNASDSTLLSWNRSLGRIQEDSAKAAAAIIRDQERVAARMQQISKAVADYRASQMASVPAVGGVAREAGNDVQHFIDLNNRLEDYRDRAIHAHLAAQKLAQAEAAGATVTAKAAVATKKGSEALHGLSFTSGQAAREYAVLVNELQRGDFTRFQGSLITLGNRVGLMPKLFTGAGASIAAFVAVLATLAIGAGAGAAEQEGFNKAMAATADFAQTSYGEIIQMSRAMSDASVTTGEMKDALLAVAESGRFFRDEIQDVGAGVADMARVSGKSVEEVVKIFIRLKEDPLRAVNDLNKSMHFLDVATRDAIRSAQEHGDMERAAALALEAVERASSKAKVTMVEDAGYIVRAWRGIKSVISDVKEAILDLGRAQSIEEKRESARLRLIEANSTWMRAKQGYSFVERGGSRLNVDANKAQTELISAAAAYKQLNEQIANTNALKDRNTEQQRSNQLALEASQRMHEESLQFDRKARREHELATAAHDYALAQKAYAGDQAKLNQLSKEYDGIVAGINHRYRDFKTGHQGLTDAERAARKEVTAHANELKSLTIDIEQHRSVVEEAANSQDKLSEVEKWAIQVLARMGTEYSHLTEAEKRKAEQDIQNIVDVDRLNRAQEEHIKLLEITARALEDVDRAGRGRASQMERELRDMAHGSGFSELQNALDQVTDRFISARIRLMEQFRAENKLGTKEYIDGINQLNAAEKDQLERERSYYAERKAMMADWRNGARRALEDFYDKANDVAGQTNTAFTGLFDDLTDAVWNFASGAESSFKKMVISFLTELGKMEIRIAMSKILMAIFGGSFGGGGADYSSWDSIVSMGMGSVNAKGGAFDQGMKVFARGGIVTSPTLFPMARGTGLMGEAGPEGILPLARNGNGVLGVRAMGGGGMDDVNVSVQVNVDNNGNSTTRARVEGSDSGDARQLGDLVASKTKQVMMDEMRPGGLLWRMKNG